MLHLFSDISRAVAQSTERRFTWVMLRAVLLTFALLVGIYLLLVWFVQGILPDWSWIPFVSAPNFFDIASNWALAGVMIWASSLLMFPVASLFVGFFLDEIAEAVEDKHYTHLPKVSPASWSDIIVDSGKFLGVMLLANLFALIVYFMANIFAPLVFLIVNGYLLSREYFQLVALRRLSEGDATRLRKKHFGKIWVMGCVMALPLAVPIANLVVPVLGVAAFTHLYHRVAATAETA